MPKAYPQDDFDFDAFFEQWQDGVENAHVKQIMEALAAEGRRITERDAGPAAATPGPA